MFSTLIEAQKEIVINYIDRLQEFLDDDRKWDDIDDSIQEYPAWCVKESDTYCAYDEENDLIATWKYEN